MKYLIIFFVPSTPTVFIFSNFKSDWPAVCGTDVMPARCIITSNWGINLLKLSVSKISNCLNLIPRCPID